MLVVYNKSELAEFNDWGQSLATKVNPKRLVVGLQVASFAVESKCWQEIICLGLKLRREMMQMLIEKSR